MNETLYALLNNNNRYDLEDGLALASDLIVHTCNVDSIYKWWSWTPYIVQELRSKWQFYHLYNILIYPFIRSFV